MKKSTIIESWRLNSSEWIKAIEEGSIESRKITSPAIYDTILKIRPSKVLDLGCGEGWLTNMLNKSGIQTIGIDGMETLIERAKTKNGQYYVKSFEDIIQDNSVPDAPYEAIVFNFCLYENEETEMLLKAIKNLLTGKNLVIIQTLHPFAFIGAGCKYQNQWFDDSWKGLKGNFRSPHRWYSRTLEGWIDTINRSGFNLVEIKEPTIEQSTIPSSIIFVMSYI